MAILPAARIKGRVHFGIITIRTDEFQAVLQRFPSQDQIQGKNRLYSLNHFKVGRHTYSAAIVRCPEQGTGEAQDTARDLIEDLDPRWLVVVGIAGGVLSDDFTLGDVIVGTQIIDFTREATKQGEPPEFDLSGGPAHKSVRAVVAELAALEKELGDWNSPDVVGRQRPQVAVPTSDDLYYGPDEWKKRTRASIEKHFGGSARTRPVVQSGPIASSDRLVKDADLAELLQHRAARTVCCVEMEAAGVYRAARRAEREYPVLVVRGLSDIVGFKRDDAWTRYACHTAASFTSAFLRVIAPLLSSPSGQPSDEARPRDAPEPNSGTNKRWVFAVAGITALFLLLAVADYWPSSPTRTPTSTHTPPVASAPIFDPTPTMTSAPTSPPTSTPLPAATVTVPPSIATGVPCVASSRPTISKDPIRGVITITEPASDCTVVGATEIIELAWSEIRVGRFELRALVYSPMHDTYSVRQCSPGTSILKEENGTAECALTLDKEPQYEIVIVLVDTGAASQLDKHGEGLTWPGDFPTGGIAEKAVRVVVTR